MNSLGVRGGTSKNFPLHARLVRLLFIPLGRKPIDHLSEVIPEGECFFACVDIENKEVSCELEQQAMEITATRSLSAMRPWEIEPRYEKQKACSQEISKHLYLTRFITLKNTYISERILTYIIYLNCKLFFLVGLGSLEITCLPRDPRFAGF